MVGFTATPVCTASEDADKLLRIVKGPRPSDDDAGNEGFVSFYNSLPRANFPRVLPAGVPRTMLPLIRPVTVPPRPRVVCMGRVPEMTPVLLTASTVASAVCPAVREV